MNEISEKKAYFIGGGIASLAGAVFLIRDAKFRGENITIFEQESENGGSLDGSDLPYVSRGGRMFEEKYLCMFNLLSEIPSINDPKVSAKNDIFQFNKEVVSDAESRLIKNKQHVDVSSYKLSWIHQLEMLRLILNPKEEINMTIQDWFSESFFKTNFWYLWTTSFSFQPWSNVEELKRYFLRFIHLLPGFNRYIKILRTRFNQEDSIIRPIVNRNKMNIFFGAMDFFLIKLETM